MKKVSIRKWTATGKFCVTAFFLAVLNILPSQAQQPVPEPQDSAAAMNAFIGKIQKAYSHAAYLGFRVKYLYANADQPGQYLDSLTGEVGMDKGRSRFAIEGTVTVLTGRYAIQVMEEDKAIYLSSASRAAVSNPVSTLDSVFAHIRGVKAEISHRDESDRMILTFPPGQAYVSLEIKIDARTGYFQAITYDLNTAGLVGQEMIDRPGHPGPYQSRGRMVILFTDYQHGHFGDSVFKEENFFTKTAGRFEPAARYKDYHIFLASSNL